MGPPLAGKLSQSLNTLSSTKSFFQNSFSLLIESRIHKGCLFS